MGIEPVSSALQSGRLRSSEISVLGHPPGPTPPHIIREITDRVLSITGVLFLVHNRGYGCLIFGAISTPIPDHPEMAGNCGIFSLD